MLVNFVTFNRTSCQNLQPKNKWEWVSLDVLHNKHPFTSSILPSLYFMRSWVFNLFPIANHRRKACLGMHHENYTTLYHNTSVPLSRIEAQTFLTVKSTSLFASSIHRTLSFESVYVGTSILASQGYLLIHHWGHFQPELSIMSEALSFRLNPAWKISFPYSVN